MRHLIERLEEMIVGAGKAKPLIPDVGSVKWTKDMYGSVSAMVGGYDVFISEYDGWWNWETQDPEQPHPNGMGQKKNLAAAKKDAVRHLQKRFNK